MNFLLLALALTRCEFLRFWGGRSRVAEFAGLEHFLTDARPMRSWTVLLSPVGQVAGGLPGALPKPTPGTAL